MKDVRWLQRFNSYENALAVLEKAVSLAGERPLTELEEQGLIQGFEFTHELAWNMVKDFLEEKGFADIHGSRDITRLAFREGYFENGEVWMEMIESRNKSSHTYNADTADSIAKAILGSYIDEFRKLKEMMDRFRKIDGQDGEKNVRPS
jgi:nucleotidyltransferase substrate binding protein (TIGR01987 family)